MNGKSFLQAILGPDGAAALEKAADRIPVLGSVLVPRTVVAWLTASVRVQYEGEIPGISNSYIALHKNEHNLLSGAVTIGEEVHTFEDEPLLHVAAAIGVAIGIDDQPLDPNLRGLELTKLGKSIDLLVCGKVAARLLSEGEPFEKAIGTIKPGRPIMEGGKAFDYSHVLSPEHRKAGYSLEVHHNSDSGTMYAKVHHSGKMIGETKGDHKPVARTLGIEASDLDEPHRGKGLGSAMYEGLMAHSKNVLGATHVIGDVHSTMAAKVHESLSTKHGMKYKKTPTPFPHLASPQPGPHDAMHGPYKYTIKEEMHGSAAKPREAEPPEPPVHSQPRMMKRELIISKSDAQRKCGDCGGRQFSGDTFSGCICWRDLAKNVAVVSGKEKYTLKFSGGDWDDDAISALWAAFKE